MNSAKHPNRQLACLIHELLDIPINRSPNEGSAILAAVLQTITTALQRGESVQIRGFGTFKVVERTHRPTPVNILANDAHGRPIARSQTLRHYTPQRLVIFEPSLPLMAMLNHDSPNFKERRALQRWQR